MRLHPEEVTRLRRTSSVEAFAHPDFRRFWLAALVSNSGSWMQSATIPFVVYDLTGRNSAVGATGFAQYFPIMLSGAIGGLLADRFPRRLVLAAMQVVQAIAAAALWWEIRSDRPSVAIIAAIVFCEGLATGLNVPVWQAFVSDLVPRPLLANAVTLNSAQFNAARFIGPLLAGVVIAWFGASTAFLINAVSFVVVLGPLALVPSRPAANVSSDGVLARLRAGVADISSSPPLRTACIVIALVAGIGSPLFSFLSAEFGQRLLGVDGWRLGLLVGSPGLGSVLVAPWLLSRRSPRVGLTLTVAVGAYGLGVVGVAASRWLGASVASGLVFGAAYLTIATSLNTTVQLNANDAIRGTTISLYLMCLTGALPVGLWLWGAAADVVGLRPVASVAGVGLLGVAVAAWRRGDARVFDVDPVLPAGNEGTASADVPRTHR